MKLNIKDQLDAYLPEKTKANLLLKAFSLGKVPLLFLTGASIQSIDVNHCQIKMPFNKLIKNHLGSVYFGALAIGADACVGFLAAYQIEKTQRPISLVFKSFEAQFLKRAEGPTIFSCDQGERINELIQKCMKTGERHHDKIAAKAMCRGEIVAEFQLELSLKIKS